MLQIVNYLNKIFVKLSDVAVFECHIFIVIKNEIVSAILRNYVIFWLFRIVDVFMRVYFYKFTKIVKVVEKGINI